MFTEGARELSHAERIARVSGIQKTIPRELIRVQIVQGRPKEMWGFVWLNRLPFVFRAWPSRVHEDLEFIKNGFNVKTGWGFVHVPRYPLDFVAPIMTEPLNEGDMSYMLTKLNPGVDREIRGNELIELFQKVLRAREPKYNHFRGCYDRDEAIRRAYGTAVNIACDEKQSSLSFLS